MARKNERKYTFYDQQHSSGGKVSVALGIVSFVMFLGAVVLSIVFQGRAGMIVGGIGIVAMLLSIYGFIAGLRSFGEPYTYRGYSIVGSIGSGTVMVLWIMLFLIGLRG